MAGVLQRFGPYFENGGYMIDQAWQSRMVEGMTRAYMVGDRVAGFGHQAVIALYPASETGEALQPGPRLYSDADDPRFQELRQSLEHRWVGTLPHCHCFGMSTFCWEMERLSPLNDTWCVKSM